MSECVCLILRNDKSILSIINCFNFVQNLNKLSKIILYSYTPDSIESIKKYCGSISNHFPNIDVEIVSDLKSKYRDYIYILSEKDYDMTKSSGNFYSFFKNIVVNSSEIIVKNKVEKSNEKSNQEDLNILDYTGDKTLDVELSVNDKPTRVKWLGKRQREYSNEILNNDPTVLIQQYFIHPDKNRQKELDYCLNQNINNKFIDKIVLLNEEIYKADILNNPKIQQINIKRRLKFSQIMRYIKYDLSNSNVIFSNSDMFFDETLESIKYGDFNIKKSLDTVCRFEFDINKTLDECVLRRNPRYHSQDAWIVHSSHIKEMSNSDINKFDFQLGIAACDQKVIAEFDSLNYNIYNNPNIIKGYHFHTTEIRDYDPKDMLPLPYGYILPIIDNRTKNDDFMKEAKLFWQYPVITEKTFFEQNWKDSEYLPIPWATIIDKFPNLIEQIIPIIRKHYTGKSYYTCCQTIYLDKLIPLMKSCNVTKIYTPHKCKDVDKLEGIELVACPLYAVNVEDSERNTEFEDIDLVNRDTKYLYSFKGAWEPHYISNIRQEIFKMKHAEDTVIQNIGKWHFLNDVYTNIQTSDCQVHNTQDKKNRTSEYNQLLLDSKFSLCPSGAGPSSIRFWESLAVGCIPVLLADTLELPYHKDWNKSILTVSEKNVSNLELLRDITDSEIVERRKKCIEIYDYFKNNYKNENNDKTICSNIIEFGTSYGGFYYPENLPGLDENSVIYCFGAGEDISHDVIIGKQTGADIHIFDPTPRAINHVTYIKKLMNGTVKKIDNKRYGGGDPNYLNMILNNRINSDKLYFHEYGLYTSDCVKKFYAPENPEYVSYSLIDNVRSDNYIEVPLKSIFTIMKELNHTKIDLFKIDIEGIECDILEQLIENSIYPKYLSVDFDSGWNFPPEHQQRDRCTTIINRLLKTGYKLLNHSGSDFSFMYKNVTNNNLTNNIRNINDSNHLTNNKFLFYVTKLGPPDKSKYQHPLVVFAEGLKKMGIGFDAICNNYKCSDGSYLFNEKKNLDYNDYSFIVTGYTSDQIDLNILTNKDRKYKTIMFDWSDGFYQYINNSKYYDYYFACNYNSKILDRYSNIYPLTFGYTERMLDHCISKPFNQRHDNILYSHRLEHPIRNYMKNSVYSNFSNFVTYFSDNFKSPDKDDSDYILWHQSGRRHNKEFYKILASSKISDCIGGYIKNISADQNIIYQVDSFKLWESFLSGCCVIMINLDLANIKFPYQPVNMKHYIGININKSSDLNVIKQIISGEINTELIAREGQAWAKKYYNQKKYAKYIIDKVSYNNKSIVHYCCGSYDIGDYGGVAHFDYLFKHVFPFRKFFKGPNQKIDLINYLKNNPDTIVVTDNHLACDIPNEYKVFLIHHGCALTTAERNPDWQEPWKSLCTNGQKKMLSYRDPNNTIIISCSKSCIEDFKKYFGKTYTRFKINKILHTSKFDTNIYKKEFNSNIPIVLGNWDYGKKGLKIIERLVNKTNKFKFKKLSIYPNNSNIDEFNLKKQNLYLESDIFLQTSNSEGGPYATIDAMVCGIPVVATNVGMFEYNDDIPDNCFVRINIDKLDDTEYIISKLEYAWQNKEMLTYNARNWFIQNCSFDLWCNRIKSAIENGFN